MNRRFKQGVLSVVLVGLLRGAPLRANDTSSKPSEPPPPDYAAVARKATFQSHLGLTTEQAAQLEAEFKARLAIIGPLREKSRQGAEKLKQQIDAKAKDSEIQVTLDLLKQTDDAIQAENESFGKKLATFLTPTQQGKMLLSMLGRPRQHPGPMHGTSMGGHPGMLPDTAGHTSPPSAPPAEADQGGEQGETGH